MTSGLAVFGWLIFAWGAALMFIAIRPGKDRMRSPTRRTAGILSGAVFCLLALTVILTDATSMTREVLLAGAIVAGAVSWYLGLHAKKVDRKLR